VETSPVAVVAYYLFAGDIVFAEQVGGVTEHPCALTQPGSLPPFRYTPDGVLVGSRPATGGWIFRCHHVTPVRIEK
jgi:hypothetical protein